MDHLKRGFQFLNQAGRIARNSPTVLQPLGILLAGGIAAALVFSAVIALCVTRLGAVGAGLAGFFGVLLAVVLLVAGYLASVEVARRVALSLAPDANPEEGPAWSVRDHALDLVGVAFASVFAGPLRATGLGRSGPLVAPWARVIALVSPAMAVEKLDLKHGLERASQMACDNLLFINPGQIAAGWAGAITGLPFAVGGGLLGWALARGVELSHWSSPLKTPAALVVGITAASLCILVAIGETAYAAAAYRACLYTWARSVESGRAHSGPAETGTPLALDPPQPLAACLAGLESLTAPVYLDSNETEV